MSKSYAGMFCGKVINSLPWLGLEGLFGLKPGGVTFLFFLFVFPFCSFSLSALFYGCRTLIPGFQLALGSHTRFCP